ncbi:crotonobetainyl-CoA:carnitine CoA-transferase CaiB-like acyl-CoA transferase [Novosphingobium sp. PhB165]|uniref:CoA transferase n=1 Tax=Novosphingobium sp. PhB165 TaxID=2485105 RepID=UPI00104CD793|nr:CoA transferase [Novosphingobium sp. PhB165]TCM20479.1 crotonobetainyl-CoA:carnitine CoA-transferase CaiB-like acyl-CoA transferase [Novosphingobium sp. PhB165]
MSAPLDGLRVVVHASGVAAAYAARLLGVQGAEVIFVEPPCGSVLRDEPPFVPSGEGAKPTSALFAYLAAGARSIVCDLTAEEGRAALGGLLSACDIFIDDTPLALRQAGGLDEPTVTARHPQLVHVSVLPFGSHGPKAHWKASEINLQHASGEGNLLPNGLSVELFPDRAPVKIAGHFAEMQGGIAAALGALSALWVRDDVGGQFVDIASQDAALAVGAFAIQRLGDGSIEHRVERSFRYGGVVPCADGFVELLTLEQRQWDGLVKLLGSPQWALDPALADSLERSRRGPEINRHIREWAIVRKVDDIVAEGQKLSVPIARYKTPAEILRGSQEHHRRLFQPVPVSGTGLVNMLVSPVHVDGTPLSLRGGPPELGEMNHIPAEVLS